MTLQLEGLTRRYGSVVALNELTFSVPNGQVVGFLGPNGSGKTTTMRAVFGLVTLDSGRVTWNGSPIGQPQRRTFGYVPRNGGCIQACWWASRWSTWPACTACRPTM